MNFTESNSKYDDLEKKSVLELLQGINAEDKTVPLAVEKAIPQIEKLVGALVTRMQMGGRLFYIGAGTSGRLGIVDASECPPTFGVPEDWVIGIIAGGDTAIRRAVEFAEDDREQAWKDLEAYKITNLDTLLGIAASGRTPYVVGGLKTAQEKGILTACITCNLGTEVAHFADIPIEVPVGAEFVTGSTRMKAGTAQKLVLNMISTATMIQLGRVKGNKMVDMQLANQKLWERGTKMIMQALACDAEKALMLLKKYGNVRQAIENSEKF
ncbi:MAG: N-acetylmuramic acid 6-phosphate etherase [Thermonemataceae bacterium]|nr:N-acetylmuramic acid 6-phosphate etherase [Thermonemataceae bacterium]